MSIEAILAPRPAQGVDRRAIGTLSFAHGCVDLAAGAVPALLPFLIIERGYSYAQTTALLLALTVTSSILQPLFGHMADKKPMPWIMPTGLIIAGIGVALVGLTEAYWLSFLLISASGTGGAAFHPEAARYANYVSGSMRARGMSIFSVGGNTGVAFGPILVTPLVVAFGLTGTIWLLVPYALFAGLLIWSLPYLNRFAPEAATNAKTETDGDTESTDESRSADNWGLFWLLATVSALRSVVYYGAQAFIPAYFILTFAATAGEANAALTILLISGAFGTLVGGWVADHLGLKRILLICLGALPPLIGLVLISGQGLGYALVGLIGFFTVGTFSPTVVIGQQLLPSRIGIASGVTLGAAIGVGGALAAALGPVADAAGLETAIIILALLPIPAILLSLPLPGRGHFGARSRQPLPVGSAGE